MLRRLAAPLALALPLVLPALAVADDSDGQTPAQQRAEEKSQERERLRRLDRIDRDDRAVLESKLGQAAPEFTTALDWIGGDAPSMKSLRGKVVVIQTFTTKGSGGRAALERAMKALEGFPASDVQLIAIHTPEGADRATTMLEKIELTCPVAIDQDGSYCDAIGAYKRPVNVVIDRTGDMKASGLNPDGLVATVNEFMAEPFDPSNLPNALPSETSRLPADFPKYSAPVGKAADLRGKPAPAVGRVNWWNGTPNTDGKLAIVDFWATWCGPCRMAIPHMNEIAQAFPNDVACMGISDEAPRKFEEGLKDKNLRKSSFEYAVGVDPSGTMKKGFSVAAIPHVVVISSDGIVRWQGHPTELTADVVRELVAANRGLSESRGSAKASTDRWQRELASDTRRRN